MAYNGFTHILYFHPTVYPFVHIVRLYSSRNFWYTTHVPNILGQQFLAFVKNQFRTICFVLSVSAFGQTSANVFIYREKSLLNGASSRIRSLSHGYVLIVRGFLTRSQWEHIQRNRERSQGLMLASCLRLTMNKTMDNSKFFAQTIHLIPCGRANKKVNYLTGKSLPRVQG